MNLSDYIGQTITVKLRYGDCLTSYVYKSATNPRYPIRFSNDTFTNDGRLYAYTESDYDIIAIISTDNSTSSNNTNTTNQTPQTVSDFIALLTAVKEQYGDVQVRYANDREEAMCDGCQYEFDDIIIVGGNKSLIHSNNGNDKPALVFIR